MFTGIIQALGRITAVAERNGERRFRIDCGKLDCASLRPGDSIAVNGVCLTAVAVNGGEIMVDVSRETLRCTTCGDLAVGSAVNLEPALRPHTPLGGHFVSGHVDGVGSVAELTPTGSCRILTIAISPALARYVAVKGSICVDGVSLTVNAVAGQSFQVNIIPHTLAHTIIGGYRPGTRVNIEVDLLARYLERLLEARGAAAGLDPARLRVHGFIQDEE